MPPPLSDVLLELRRLFTDQLTARVTTIHAHFLRLDPADWQPAETATLRRLVHGLSNSAGTFGMQSISEAARSLETRLAALLRDGKAPAATEWQTIGAELERLAQQVRTGLTAPTFHLKPPPAPHPDRASLIYLLEDSPAQAAYLKQVLLNEGYRVQAFTDPADFRTALAAPDAERPAAVVMDMDFPEDADSGATRISALGLGGSAGIPVVVVSTRDDLQGRLAAFRAGACRYLVKPVEAGRLTELLESLTGRQPLKPYRVMLVDDDPLLLDTHAAILRAAGMEVRTLSEPLQTLDVLDAFTPDVLLLDVHMPDASGPELAAVLRESDAHLHLPILFLSTETNMTRQMLALDLGGDDFLVKPVLPDHLIAAVTARAQRARQDAAIQRRLETTLYEREREHLALDHHAIVSITDRAGTITYVNDKFCEISGYSRDELLDQNHRIIKSGEHPPAFYQRLWHTISSGQVWQGEVCNRRKDGSLYWVESTITPFLDGDGIPYQYVSIRTDISHVKVSESLLRLRTEAIEAASNSILIVDARHPDMGIIYVNAAFERLTGYAPEEVLERNCRFLRGEDHDQAGLKALRAAIQQGRGAKVLLRNYRKDGSLFWNELSIAPVRDSRNQLTHFIGVQHDVSERIGTTAKIEQQRDLQRMISTAAAGLLAAPADRLDAAINAALRDSGEQLGADRAYLFLYSEDGARMSNTHEWCAPGIEPQRDKTENMPLDALPWWQEQISSRGIVMVPDVAALPPQAAAEKAVFEDRQIQSLFAFPLQRDGRTCGFVGYDAVRIRRDWEADEVELLKVMGDVIGSALARQRAETALRESEERHRLILTCSDLGTWDWNIASGRVDFNARWAEIRGYRLDEIEPHVDAWKSGIHPDDLDVLSPLLEAHFAGRTALFQAEYRVRSKTGEWVWILDRGAVIRRDASGAPLRMAGTEMDINARKLAEQAAEVHKERLRRGQSYANLGTWEWNIQTGELFWTERIAPLFGYPNGELETSYDNFLGAIHPDDRQAVIDAVNACVERDVPYETEHRVVWPDGTVRWLLERGAVARDSDGTPLQMLGIVQDTTERKHAEQALLENQAKLAGLFALSPLGIALTDMSGRYIEFNEAFRAIVGYPADELETLDYWALTPDEYAAGEAAQLEMLKASGRYGPYEKVYRQKNGNLVPIRLNGILVKDSSGESRIWSIVEDVTDSKRAEQALITARDEADRANQAKSEFLSSMSHELRTPMNAILGFSQLMEYDAALPGEHQDSVREILKAGYHLLELINEVLDLAKVESGNIDLSLEPVEVCPIVDECLSLVETLADKRDIRVSHAGLAGAAVRADRTRLKQALLNLLSNAVKYNREGGSVKLDVEPGGTDRLRIRVTDTGPGIPAARMAELFQPFNRLGAENSTIEGSGIGLTITRRIVEMMGGTVGAESEPGVGSSFWIELPLESMPELDSGHARAAVRRTASGIQPDDAQHIVLYVEDNPSNIKLIAQILGRRRHIHLLTAHTPELGIELARARRPELILLDINMSGLDGYQVLNVLKAEGLLENTPVIAVTANAMPRDIERGRAAGFTDYLTKPLDIGHFNQIVDAWLAGRLPPKNRPGHPAPIDIG